MRLAFIAALQLLPARQRAVLRCATCWRSARPRSPRCWTRPRSAVDSLLRRARAHLAAGRPVEHELVEPAEAAERRLLDAYVEAFTRADAGALVELLRVDVEMEMPPTPTWFTGRDAVVGFLATRVLRTAGQWRMRPTRANGQPAVVVHKGTHDGYAPYGVHVLGLLGGRIARITAFNDPAWSRRSTSSPRVRAARRAPRAPGPRSPPWPRSARSGGRRRVARRPRCR